MSWWCWASAECVRKPVHRQRWESSNSLLTCFKNIHYITTIKNMINAFYWQKKIILGDQNMVTTLSLYLCLWGRREIRQLICSNFLYHLFYGLLTGLFQWALSVFRLHSFFTSLISWCLLWFSGYPLSGQRLFLLNTIVNVLNGAFILVLKPFLYALCCFLQLTYLVRKW